MCRTDQLRVAGLAQEDEADEHARENAAADQTVDEELKRVRLEVAAFADVFAGR